MFYTDSDNFFYVIFYYYSGIASMGVVCDTRSGAQKNKQSISEVQDEVSTFAWVRYFYLLICKLLSRSVHRTPNYTNSEYFFCLLFEYFFQIKVLN